MAPRLRAHTDTHTNTSGKSLWALEIDPICLSPGNKQLIFLVNSAVSGEALLNWKSGLTMDYLKLVIVVIQLLCSKRAPAQLGLTARIQRVWGSQGALYKSLPSLLIMLCIMKSLQKYHPWGMRCTLTQKVSSVLGDASGITAEWAEGWIPTCLITAAPELLLCVNGTSGVQEGENMLVGSSWLVSSPLLSLQKPVCFHKGRNRGEGLQATGKAELGCSFSATCSVHEEIFRWGKTVGWRVEEFTLCYSELPGRCSVSLPEDLSWKNKLAPSSCEKRRGLREVWESSERGRIESSPSSFSGMWSFLHTLLCLLAVWWEHFIPSLPTLLCQRPLQHPLLRWNLWFLNKWVWSLCW